MWVSAPWPVRRPGGIGPASNSRSRRPDLFRPPYRGLRRPDSFPTVLGRAAPALARVLREHLGKGLTHVFPCGRDALAHPTAVQVLAPMPGHYLARRQQCGTRVDRPVFSVAGDRQLPCIALLHGSGVAGGVGSAPNETGARSSRCESTIAAWPGLHWKVWNSGRTAGHWRWITRTPGKTCWPSGGGSPVPGFHSMVIGSSVRDVPGW